MSNIIDLYNYKFVAEKSLGGNNFFDTEEQIKQLNLRQEKFVSSVDYSDMSNQVKFSSAEQVYTSAFNYINTSYPYDGSNVEKLKWINSLSDIEYNLYVNEYPKSVGHVSLSSSQFIEVYSNFKEKSTPLDTINSVSKNSYNTTIDFKQGFTFESWMKFEENDVNTNILTINAISESEGKLVEIELLSITRDAGVDPKITIQNSEYSGSFSTIITDNQWHHYSIFVQEGLAKLYIDGKISDVIDDLNIRALKDSYIFVPLGLMLIPLASKDDFGDFNRSAVFAIGGGDKTSFDDCRMWNGERTPEKIGRYWITNVDGNDISDPNNSSLIFYYKFNEGWDNEYRFLCVDNSGRKNDGEIRDYSADCIKDESAIDIFLRNNTNEDYFNGLQFVSFNDSSKKLKISPGEVPDVSYGGLDYSSGIKAYFEEKIKAAQEYDQHNFHSLYNKFPSWLLASEEEKDVKHLKQLVQIICYYFDDLYLKTKEITNYKEINYQTDLDKIYPFYDKILTSTGFDVSDLFSELTEIEKNSSRSESHIFSADVNKVKNAIYKNIYNNLSYILKSKGTEKAIKSFLRSYGVNENLVRINLYADAGTFDVNENLSQTVVKKKIVHLKEDNIIQLSTNIDEPDYFSLETSVMLSKNLNIQNNTTSSIFGIKNSLNDEYYVTLEKTYDNKNKFILNKLSGSTLLTSSYQINNYDIHDGTVWNFILRKKPNLDTLEGAPSDYSSTIELYGVNYNTANVQEFSCSLEYDNSNNLTYFIGCKKDSIGNTVHEANSKYLYCNFWTDYLNNNTIKSHNKDVMNYGVD